MSTSQNSNILHLNSRIPNFPGVAPVYWRKDFPDSGDFFYDATLRLCSTLDIEEAFADFLVYLQKSMPVLGIDVARIHMDLQQVESVLFSDETETVLTDTCITLTPSQMQDAHDSLMKQEVEEEGLLAVSLDEPMGRLFTTLSTKGRKPPFFLLRIRSGQEFWVGVTFTFASPPLPEHLSRLRSLRAPLLMALSNSMRYREVEALRSLIVRENLELRTQLGRRPDKEIIGASSGLEPVIRQARLAGATDVPVLVLGETGAGKEVIAHTVHSFSRRAGAPFIAVNCGAIPASLIDSELFGHSKGAFTGALKDHKGYFEQAHGGTLFLDEIGELPHAVQSRLLRVLQDKTITRIGNANPVEVDFRLIAATHRDLRAMVAEGTFREDLYYRLRVVQLQVPALRERKQDIPLLVMHFLQVGAKRFGILPPPVAAGEMERLVAYDWPGNVRELRNVVAEALVLMPQGPLLFHLETDSTTPEGNCTDNGPQNTQEHAEAPVVLPTLDEVEFRYFSALLQECHGRISGPFGAAVKAGLKPNTLRFRLDKLGIPYGKKR